MRLPQYSRQVKQRLGLFGRTVCAACLGAMALTGCQNGFLDPTEMGKFPKQPLMKPIVKNLDPSVDEPVLQFGSASDVRPQDLVPQSGDYSIGPNDLVTVTITDLVGPGIQSAETKRVSESGTVSLPLVGPVKAAGLTEAQFETAVQQAYGDAQLIRNAQVSVTVVEARNRTFSILGSVARAGQYQILQSDFRLLDALVLAGDVSNVGIDYIFVIRKKSSEPTGAPGAPADMPHGTTKPNTDVLTPRSDAGPHSGATKVVVTGQPRHRLDLMTQGQDPAAAANTPATQPAADIEGRVITVDGQQVPADQSGTPAAAPAAPTDAPMTTATPTAVDGDKKFEFGAPEEPGDVRVIRVPLEQLKNGELKYNIVIRPLDMIFAPLPPIGEYYMGGHIARVGVYSLNGRKITLKQAVISAGMLDALAVPQRTQVVRRLGEKEMFVTVDLAKIFAGETPDIFLKPDDQVMVGTAPWAPFLAAVRNGFRITYGFGFLYDRNYAPTNQNN